MGAFDRFSNTSFFSFVFFLVFFVLLFITETPLISWAFSHATSNPSATRVERRTSMSIIQIPFFNVLSSPYTAPLPPPPAAPPLRGGTGGKALGRVGLVAGLASASLMIAQVASPLLLFTTPSPAPSTAPGLAPQTQRPVMGAAEGGAAAVGRQLMALPPRTLSSLLSSLCFSFFCNNVARCTGWSHVLGESPVLYVSFLCICSCFSVPCRSSSTSPNPNPNPNQRTSHPSRPFLSLISQDT